MADMRQVLEFVLKADAKNAVKGFRDVAGAAGQTQAAVDGAGRGWKTSMKSAALAATPWISGAMAAGAAALKAADKFMTLALAASKFSDATGMSTEDASRLIEVTGDIGISAGSVEAAINRMSKSLGVSTDAFSNLGIEIVKTSQGNVDITATFLQAIDAINGIKDPTKRAAAAAQVFGKGWRDMAELIKMGSRDVAAAMGSVSEGKVISEDEVNKAKRYREAMDALSDGMEELAIIVGESVMPLLTDVANKISEIIKVAGPIMKLTDKGTGGMTPSKEDVGKAGDAARSLLDARRQMYNAVEDVINKTTRPEQLVPLFSVQMEIFRKNTDATAVSALALDAAFSVQGDTIMDVAAAELIAAANAKKLAKAEAQARSEADALRASWNALLNPLQNEQSWINLQEQFLDVKDAVEEYNAANKRGFKTEEERKRALLKVQGEQNALKQSIIDTTKALGNVDPETTKRILFLVDAGMLDEALALLAELEERAKSENIVYFLGGNIPDPTNKGQNQGKNSWAGGMVDTQGSWVGERGAEWFQPTAAGRIYTAGELGRAIGASAPVVGGNTYVINQSLGPGVDAALAGRAVVEAIAAYERMAGKGWRN